MFGKLKGFSSDINIKVSISKEEKDGKYEEDTVVNKALVRYYKEREEPFPDWLPVKDSLRNLNKKFSNLGLSQQQQQTQQTLQQQVSNVDTQFKPRVSQSQSQSQSAAQQQLSSRYHPVQVHQMPTSRFGSQRRAQVQGQQSGNSSASPSPQPHSRFKPYRPPAAPKFGNTPSANHHTAHAPENGNGAPVSRFSSFKRT